MDKPREVAAALLFAICFVVPVASWAQCSDSTTIFYYYYPNVGRINANNVDSTIGGVVVGNYWYLWTTSAVGTAYKDGTQTHTGSVTGSAGGIALTCPRLSNQS